MSETEAQTTKKRTKKDDYIVQGSILAAAAVLTKIIGVVYRIPLTNILGDEGSGAYLGKRFVGDCIKQQLPSGLLEGLLKEYNLTVAEILDKVYRQPQGNRFLASLTPYIYKHKHLPEVREFLIECFGEFFRRNLLSYPEHNRIPVSFVGSIAWFFQDELKEAARKFNLHTGIFIQSPIQELKGFHLPEKRKCV